MHSVSPSSDLVITQRKPEYSQKRNSLKCLHTVLCGQLPHLYFLFNISQDRDYTGDHMFWVPRSSVDTILFITNHCTLSISGIFPVLSRTLVIVALVKSLEGNDGTSLLCSPTSTGLIHSSSLNYLMKTVLKRIIIALNFLVCFNFSVPVLCSIFMYS